VFLQSGTKTRFDRKGGKKKELGLEVQERALLGGCYVGGIREELIYIPGNAGWKEGLIKMNPSSILSKKKGEKSDAVLFSDLVRGFTTRKEWKINELFPSGEKMATGEDRGKKTGIMKERI